jgi:energy-converting hydrogenase Eha subunit F
MTTKHIKDITFNRVWIITLHSGAVIECGLNLADAIEKTQLYTSPQPQLSMSSGILDPELRGAA